MNMHLSFRFHFSRRFNIKLSIYRDQWIQQVIYLSQGIFNQSDAIGKSESYEYIFTTTCHVSIVKTREKLALTPKHA